MATRRSPAPAPPRQPSQDSPANCRSRVAGGQAKAFSLRRDWNALGHFKSRGTHILRLGRLHLPHDPIVCPPGVGAPANHMRLRDDKIEVQNQRQNMRSRCPWSCVFLENTPSGHFLHHNPCHARLRPRSQGQVTSFSRRVPPGNGTPTGLRPGQAARTDSSSSPPALRGAAPLFCANTSTSTSTRLVVHGASTNCQCSTNAARVQHQHGTSRVIGWRRCRTSAEPVWYWRGTRAVGRSCDCCASTIPQYE